MDGPHSEIKRPCTDNSCEANLTVMALSFVINIVGQLDTDDAERVWPECIFNFGLLCTLPPTTCRGMILYTSRHYEIHICLIQSE